jgi:hypothetical protein
MSNKTNWLGVAILGMLTTGCGGGLDLKPSANPSARLQGQGFSVLPPPGSDWYIAEAVKDGIQFVKLEPGQKSNPDDAPHTFSVGVFPLPANGSAGTSDKDYPKAVESLLVEHFTQRRRALKSLTVSAYPAKQGLCIQYDSVQQRQRTEQNPTREYLEFADHGIVCRYSPASKNLIHGFYSQRYHTGAPLELAKSTLEEAGSFLKSIELTKAIE